jgi:hypothetical protein
MTIYIFHLSVFKLTPIKKINLIKNMQEELESGVSEIKDRQQVLGIKWLLNMDFQQLIESIDLKCVVNDNMGVCIRIREN